MIATKKDLVWLRCALTIAELAKCHRLAVGCVLVDARSQVLSTGYNGRAAGLPNCTEVLKILGPPEPNRNPFWREQSGLPLTRPFLETFPHRCQGSDAPVGQPNGCEAIHAEQNALLQCRDVRAIDTAYVSHSPCTTCVKLLLNTSCRRVVFRHEYPAPEAQTLWVSAGRVWEHWPEES